MKFSYSIKRVSKEQCFGLLRDNHYLSKISKGFKSGFNYGLFKDDSLVGVCIFTGFPVPELVKGLFGLDRNDQLGFFELSRLCLLPEVQSTEHNITSWFVSRAIKSLRKETSVRAILSYADSEYHQGTIYKACNFKYYGTTTPKKDFWINNGNGTFTKHSRGKTKGVCGEWRSRSLKHRFLMVFDNNLYPLWKEQLK